MEAHYAPAAGAESAEDFTAAACGIIPAIAAAAAASAKSRFSSMIFDSIGDILLDWLLHSSINSTATKIERCTARANAQMKELVHTNYIMHTSGWHDPYA
jgi:hypothetical protein